MEYQLQVKMEELEEHKIQTWRGMPIRMYSYVSISIRHAISLHFSIYSMMSHEWQTGGIFVDNNWIVPPSFEITQDIEGMGSCREMDRPGRTKILRKYGSIFVPSWST